MKEELLNELIEEIGDYTPEQSLFLLYLIENATEKVTLERYPFTTEGEMEKAKQSVLQCYKGVIKDIVKSAYNKQGQEGVASFSESGVSVSYETPEVPSSLLRGIIPVAKII